MSSDPCQIYFLSIILENTIFVRPKTNFSEFMKKNFHEILPKGTSCATEKSEMPILYFQNVRSKNKNPGEFKFFRFPINLKFSFF